MAKVYYVECTFCRQEYYVDKGLYDAAMSNSQQELKCPFCKKEFYLETRKEQPSKK